MEIALAGFAHDIRTPLTGVVALAELLNAADLPERERGWAAALKQSADHLLRLTSNAVDAARAARGGLVLRAEAFSPRQLADAVARALAARAKTKNLPVAISIADNLPARLIGDVTRLRSALENLIDNAVKFTERGCIRFRAAAAAARAGHVRLEFVVVDSGIGISAAELKRLLRPFAQANEEVARRYGGAGLGLAFVKRIAKAMGGTLTVSSTAGGGSTFRLSVLAQREEPRRAGLRQRRLRVLCVEDSPYGRAVLSTILTELGHEVQFAGSGRAAVEAVVRGELDAVLMDVALADIDGIEATRLIRALPPPAGRIAIIGLSGKTDAADEMAARAAGMNAYLRKPVSAAALHAALRKAARRKRT